MASYSGCWIIFSDRILSILWVIEGGDCKPEGNFFCLLLILFLFGFSVIV